MTRYSWTALRGKGLPRLASWPEMPPAVMSFLRLVPSTKRLTEFAGAPFALIVLNCVVFVRSSVTVTPGASAARSRKLRVVVGSFSICAVVTFVATSDVRADANANGQTKSARASAIAGRNRPTPSLRVMKQTSLGLKKKRPAAPSSRTRRAIVCRTPFLEPTRLPNDQRRRQGLTLAAAPPLGGQRIHEPFGRALAELDD